MLSKARGRTESLVRPIAEALARAGVTPNSLTFLGLAVGLVAAVFFVKGEQLLAGVVLLLCGGFDIIDGAVARAARKVTAFGGVLDSVADRYVDFIILIAIAYAGLAEAGLISGWSWVFIAIAGSFMVSYIRSRAEAAGSGKLDVGIAERAERILILAVGAITGYTRYAVVVIAVLTHLTVLQRLIVARRRLR